MINPQFPLLASMAAPIFKPILTPVSASSIHALFASFIGGEIFNLIRQTGAVAQVVLAILLIFSIMSWSVILT